MAGSIQSAVGTSVQTAKDGAMNAATTALDKLAAGEISTGEATKIIMLSTDTMSLSNNVIDVNEKANKNS